MMTSEAVAEGAPTSWIQRVRVPVGFLFGAAYLILAQPQAQLLVVGLALAAAGLALRTWAAGHLRKHQGLSVGGPYRWTRNPLYLGSLLTGAGFCVAAASGWLLLAFALLFSAIYLPVMRREESELEQAYDQEYRRYRRQVPWIVPSGRRSARDAAQTFSWSQVIANREHHAWAGALLLTGFLCIKLLWL